MVDTRVNRRMAAAIMMLAVSIALPACQSPGGGPPPMVQTPDGSTTSRFSLRPILDGAGYRPFYLGGYAGASYGPGVFSRPAAVGTPVTQPASPPSVTVEQGTWEPQ